MKKPIKPKKPIKSDKPPSEKTVSNFYLCKENGKFFVEEVEYYAGGSWRDSMGTLFTNHLSHTTVQKIYELMGRRDFNIDPLIIWDGCMEGWILSYTDENLNYEQDLKEYQSRFDNYESLVEVYNHDMVKYNIWKKEQEIEKLKEQINLEIKKLKDRL